jgi:phage terminase large subunit-like protein
LYAGDGLLMAWHHKPVAPWQDKAWLTSMRRERASVYQRHVLNEFASSSAQFVDMAAWDACVDAGARPVLGYKALPIWVAIDASTKRDATAVVAVTADKAEATRVHLVNHRIFQPSKKEPLNFADTIVRTVRELRDGFTLLGCYFDPFQMAAVAQQLAKDGVRMVEFPQTPANLTAIGSNLFELINAGSLLVYPDSQMRLAISRAVCKEGARGLMISKSTAAHKIDVVVALAMAAYAAVRQPQQEELPVPPPGNVVFGQPRNVPGSVFAHEGYLGVHAGSPMRPSRNEPWFHFYGPEAY